MEAHAISRMGSSRIIGSHLRDMTKNKLGFAPWVFETFAPLRARNPADTTLQYSMRVWLDHEIGKRRSDSCPSPPDDSGGTTVRSKSCSAT